MNWTFNLRLTINNDFVVKLFPMFAVTSAVWFFLCYSELVSMHEAIADAKQTESGDEKRLELD